MSEPRQAQMCAYGFENDGSPRDGKPVERVRLIEPFSTPAVEGTNYGDRGYIVARQSGVLVWATEGSLRINADPDDGAPEPPR